MYLFEQMSKFVHFQINLRLNTLHAYNSILINQAHYIYGNYLQPNAIRNLFIRAKLNFYFCIHLNSKKILQ